MGLIKNFQNKMAKQIVEEINNMNEMNMMNSTTSKTVDMTQDTSISLWDDEVSSGSVTEDDAMSIPALASGIDLIANSIASLPIKLFKINEFGEKEEVKDDPRVRLLNIAPQPFDSAYTLKYSQVKSLILNGTMYTYVVKDKRNNISALYYLDYNSVQSQMVKYGNGIYGYTYSFSLFNDYFNNLEQDCILMASKDKKRSEDIMGQGVLKKGAKVLNLALQEINSASNVLSGKVEGYLSTPDALSPQAKANIRQSWKGFGGNVIPVLEQNLQYKTISHNAKEMELLDSRKYSTELIAQLLGIPFTYLLSSATSYNNSQEESLRFMKYSLNPYIAILQEAYNKFLLTEKELLQNYRFEFDTSVILKASASEQMAYLRDAKNGGLLTVNEARSQLGLQSVEGGDFIEIPVNSYILDEEGNIILPSAEYKIKEELAIKKDEVVEEKDNKEEENLE